MKDDALNSESVKSRQTHRSLFHWGIAFWIFAWIATVCCYQAFYLNVKGCKGVNIGVGGGSIYCTLDDGIVTSTAFGVRACGFLWSKGVMEEVRHGPGMIGILANCGWRKIAGTTIVSFPIAGFLWLWLAVGLAAEIRYRRLSKVKVDGDSLVTHSSRRRLLILAAALAILAIAVPYLGTRAQVAYDATTCVLHIRNIQQAVRGWSGMQNVGLGEPIMWGDIIGVGKFLPPESSKCPSGGDYQLSSLNPAIGELAARCPHPEHQRYIHSQDTSEW